MQLGSQTVSVVQSNVLGRSDAASLTEAAADLEAQFLAEMLRHVGLDGALSGESGFGGDVFSGILVDAYAEKITRNGGLGLADEILRGLERGEP